MSSEAYIETYCKTVEEMLGRVSKKDIERVIDLFFDAWKREATMFFMGNGGSASTASHFASDLAKGTIVNSKKRMKVMCLTDNIPLVSAWVNDSGSGSVFVEQLRPWLQQGDVVVGISAHGASGHDKAGPTSQNLVQAMQLAKERKATIVGLAGFDGGAMKRMADVCLLVPIDSEPLGTPVVESIHVVLHHLISSRIKQQIAETSDE